ncbi:MAG: AI-2E family transporter [Gammaproteobacteria bacterium]|nr:AI-2E family transporter [Gammaproteobacteria bacterium]
MGDDAPRAMQNLLTVAALIIVLAAVRAAAEIVLPILVAAFLAVIFSAPISWLRARRVPRWLADLLVVGGLVLVVFGLGLFVSQSVTEFTEKLPAYQAALTDLAVDLTAFAERFGVEAAGETLRAQLDPGMALELAGVILSGFGNLVVYGTLVLLIVGFMLAERAGLRRKLDAMRTIPQGDLQHLFRSIETVNRYMAIKTLISVITGIAAGLLTALIGVDFPLLWGVLAFLLNYIPSIGSILAGTPPVLLALAQLGPASALGVAAGYLALNVTMGGIIEPRYMGRGLGLSPLVVLLSVVFWGWLLGPVGALLSVPLTMMAKMACEASPRTVWLTVLLGPNPSADPPAEAPADGEPPSGPSPSAG